MTDEQLIEAMARAVSVKRMGADENWQLYVVDQSAALAAQRETHHLIPRATEDDGELVNELTAWPASLGKGDALEVGFVSEKMQRAADRITALRAEVERVKSATRKRAYHVTEPYLSGYHVCIGFENRADAFEMHSALAALGAKP